MKIRAKVWFETCGEHIFGLGRAALLEAIDREGSIQGAARTMGLSYRRAWTMLKTSERRWQRNLVAVRRGGPGGGGARLTDEGRAVLDLFRRVDARVGKVIETQQAKLDDAAL